jgi:MFS family permease
VPSEPLLTRSFLLCALANFVQALVFNLFLHLPGHLQQLGASEVEIGFLFGATAFAAIAVRPWLGRRLDSGGRRAVIRAGGVLNTLVCAAYLSVLGVGPWLLLVRLAHGMAEAMLFSAFFTLAADLVPAARRTEGLALFGISGMLPIALAGVLGDVLIARTGYTGMFGCAAALAALSLALSLPLRDVRSGRGDGAPARGFLAGAAQRDLLPLWLLGTVFAMGLAAIFTFAKTFVLASGLGSLSVFFGAYAGAAVVLRLTLAWLPDRVGPKRVLFPALACVALGLLFLARAHAARDVIVAGALCGLGHGFTYPILSGLVVSRARESERGAALSLFTALFDLGVALGGPLFGALIPRAGYAGMFASAAGVVVAGALVFAAWDRSPRRAPLTPSSARG